MLVDLARECHVQGRHLVGSLFVALFLLLCFLSVLEFENESQVIEVCFMDAHSMFRAGLWKHPL